MIEPTSKGNILTSFLNHEPLRHDLWAKIDKHPERCRIEGFDAEGTGMFGAVLLFPAEWIADFDD